MSNQNPEQTLLKNLRHEFKESVRTLTKSR